MLSHADIEMELAITATQVATFGEQTGLVIEPLCENAIQPASVDLRLASEILLWKERPVRGAVLDDPSYASDREVDLASASSLSPALCGEGTLRKHVFDPNGRFVLEPGAFALASTIERVHIPAHLVARLEGRSSLGRVGLMVHVTAGFIDPGFRGTITLELYNANPNPLVLHHRMRIAQLSLFQLRAPATRVYAGKYQGQQGPTASRIAKDFER